MNWEAAAVGITGPLLTFAGLWLNQRYQDRRRSAALAAGHGEALERREDNRLVQVIEGWKQQLDHALKRAEVAERREDECERRCDELGRRVDEIEQEMRTAGEIEHQRRAEMVYENAHWKAHVEDCQREVQRLRHTIDEMGRAIDEGKNL